jgi:hypothetical protein
MSNYIGFEFHWPVVFAFAAIYSKVFLQFQNLQSGSPSGRVYLDSMQNECFSASHNAILINLYSNYGPVVELQISKHHLRIHNLT